MKSIKQLRVLYALPVLLSLIAFTLAASGGRKLYAALALILLIGELFTLQFFSARLKPGVSELAEGAIMAGAFFSTLWTTFAAALLITIKRH